MTQKNGAPQAITPAKRHTTANQQHEQYSTKLTAMLPREMLGLPNWLLFTDAKEPVGAKSNVPATWRTVADALAQLKRGYWLGFALRVADRIWLADFDHCLDPETGALRTWAIPYIMPFLGRTYIEISKSGDGLHVFGRGNRHWATGYSKSMPDGGKIELFDGLDANGGHGRMVVVTGNRYQDAPVMLGEMQEELNALYAGLFSAKAAKAETMPRYDAANYAPLSMSDSELYARARNNPDPLKAARFQRLEGGDTSAYKSRSEAHLALANEFAYYCGPGADGRVDSLLQQWGAQYDDSGKLERADYRASIVAKAYDGRTAFYQPRTAPIAHHVEKETEPETPTSGELAKALARIAELEAENARLMAANRSLNQRLQWERDVKTVPNKVVGASTRETASLLRRDLERTQAGKDEGFNTFPEPDGFWRMDTAAAAKRYGVSSSTLSANITELEKVGAIETKRWEVETSRGPRPRIAVRLAPKMLTPLAWERPNGEERDQGGARENAGRKPCQKCGSIADPIERRGVVTLERPFAEVACPDCGHVHEREYTGDAVEVGKRYFPGSEIPFQLEKETCPMPVTAEPDAVSTCESNHIVPSFDYLPPQRACYRCRATDWRWTGAGWQCGCQLPDAPPHPAAYEMAVS